MYNRPLQQYQPATFSGDSERLNVDNNDRL
jgi:hypothetical protein